jgi:hypothetical protein
MRQQTPHHLLEKAGSLYGNPEMQVVCAKLLFLRQGEGKKNGKREKQLV